MGATTFIDRKGNLRDLAFTVGEVFEVQQRLQIDLMDLDSIVNACTNPRSYMDLMFCLSARDGETFEEFCKVFDGQTLDDAQTALWEAIENFSPRNRRELIGKLVAKLRETDQGLIEKALDALSMERSGS